MAQHMKYTAEWTAFNKRQEYYVIECLLAEEKLCAYSGLQI